MVVYYAREGGSGKFACRRLVGVNCRDAGYTQVLMTTFRHGKLQKSRAHKGFDDHI